VAERSLAPVIVGITGKRDLAGKDEAVRASVRACFELLEAALPGSRKILLSGLAAGADTIAADVARELGWKVIAVLPFGLDEFAADFDAEGTKRLYAYADPKTGSLRNDAGRVITLPPLIDPKTDQPFDTATLARREGTTNSSRSDHYEQVGQFIAERCAVLLAVMPAGEEPGRTGGTARVAEFRLRGMFDATTERIVEASQVLHKPVELDSPQVGPAWLIDLEADGKRPDQPLDRVWLWRPLLDQSGATVKIERLKAPGRKLLIGSLRLALRMHAFNELVGTIDERQYRKEFEAGAHRVDVSRNEIEDKARSSSEDASTMLRQMRQALSVIQGGKKRALTRTVAIIASLFIATVIAIEFHLQRETLPPLVLYVASVLGVLLVFALARLRAMQQYSEDYRAVAEALRVQVAWWDAGLTSRECRVDRMYLCGTVGSLATVRAAARYLVDAALLEKSAPRPSPGGVEEWINGQIRFFETRTRERRATSYKFEDTIWFLFIGSIGMALSLFPLTMALHGENPILGWIDHRLYTAHSNVVAWLTPWLIAAMPLALFGVARWLTFRSRTLHYGPRRWTIETFNFLIGLAAGVLFAVCVYGFLLPPYEIANEVIRLGIIGGHECQSPDRICFHHVAHRVIAGSTVVAAAIAGAIRFYAERRALEAELHSYREALATFQRARNGLDGGGNGAGDRAERRRQEILLELGRSALEENEEWIRAHRVRPLEPHL
jgi:hypothetical protein